MNFYGVLDAGRSRYITRNGDNAHGVRVAAVIATDQAEGYLELILDARGQWELSLRPVPTKGGEPRTLMRGSLETGRILAAVSPDERRATLVPMQRTDGGEQPDMDPEV